MTLSFITSFPFYRIMCSFFSSLSQIILSSNFSFLLFIRFYEGFFRVPYETKVDIGIRNNRLKGDTYLAVVWSQDLGQCERKYSAILYYQIKINLST